MLYRIQRYTSRRPDTRKRWVNVIDGLNLPRANACMRRWQGMWPGRVYRIVRYIDDRQERCIEAGIRVDMTATTESYYEALLRRHAAAGLDDRHEAQEAQEARFSPIH